MSMSEDISAPSLPLRKLCCRKALEWSSLVLGPEVKSSSEIMNPGSFTASYQSHRLLLIPHVTLWFPGLSSQSHCAEVFRTLCFHSFSSRPFSIAPNFPLLQFALYLVFAIGGIPLHLLMCLLISLSQYSPNSSLFPQCISDVYYWADGGDNEKTQRVQLQELCKLCMWDEVWNKYITT